MVQRLVVGDLRVQSLTRMRGLRSHTIVGSGGSVHQEADRFLRTLEPGTDRTYAYLLVDHLRWLERECLVLDTVSLRDLQRYMGAVGAKVAGPFGGSWREGKRPYGPSTLSTAAACVKGFYLHQASLGMNQELGAQLAKTRLPTKADRARAMLGHLKREMPANPLAPTRVRRRHPKMAPEGVKQRLLEVVHTARDRLVVSWLVDGGFRIGELCGLYLADLHLREGAACGQCRSPHVHVCHRPGNANRAAAKTKYDWVLEDDTVRGGLIRRVSPAMIHTYFEYLTTEYSQESGHGMLLVQLHGPAPWAAMVDGRGAWDAAPGREPGGPRHGSSPFLQALVRDRRARRVGRQPGRHPGGGRLGIGDDGGRDLCPRRRARPRVRSGTAPCVG